MDGLAHVARYGATPLKLSPGAVVLFALVCASSSTRAQDAEARALVQRVLDAQRTNGFVLRAKLTVTDGANDARRVAQLRVKSRRDSDATRVLYEVLWSATDKGRALSLERSPNGSLKGFRFAPPAEVEQLTTAALPTAYLDSDLSVEDLTEDFWQWADAKSGGEERIEHELCKIVNLRPPADARSSYSLVRVWISPEKAAPWRIVKFDRSGKPKEFAVQKMMQHEKVWVPVITRIHTPGNTRHTLFEISRGEREVDIPVHEFAIESVRKAALVQ